MSEGGKEEVSRRKSRPTSRRGLRGPPAWHRVEKRTLTHDLTRNVCADARAVDAAFLRRSHGRKIVGQEQKLLRRREATPW
eukprot:679945-Pyramimonas_sp.AAC.1